jgi:hypothetical protein
LNGLVVGAPAAGRAVELEVISFGSVFLEIVFGHFEELPLPGEEIFVDSFAFSCGGAVAMEASRAGASAGLATLLGDDLGSRLVMEHSLREGIDLSPSQRVKGPVAGITVVLNFDGDRAFISHMPPTPAGVAPEVERWSEILQRVRPAWCYLHANEKVAGLLHEASSTAPAWPTSSSPTKKSSCVSPGCRTSERRWRRPPPGARGWS